MALEFHTYDDVMAYVRRFTDYERMVKVKPMAPYGVSRMERLLEFLGRPEQAFRAVHIAGTKGKGSTAAMVDAILRAAGLCSGLYTSPHVEHERERIQVDGQWISEPEIVRFISRMAPYLEQSLKDGETYAPTFFEIYTALAFLQFVERRVDYGVLETGLGGRLDATNVCQPVVCAITPIGFDHTDKLGETLDRIAWEKAGIIKDGVPVVCAPQDRRAMNSIVAAVEGRGCRLVQVGADVRYKVHDADATGSTVSVRTWREAHERLRVPLAGEHQALNAAMAVGLVEILRDQSAAITAEHVRAGLAALRWPARVEVLGTRPWVILDSAHNVPSALALRDALEHLFPCRRRFFVLAMSQDKDVEGILRVLAPLMDMVVFTKTSNPRAAEPADLAVRMAAVAPVASEVQADIQRALDRALALVEPQDLLCVAGSFYLAGTAREILSSLQAHKVQAR